MLVFEIKLSEREPATARTTDIIWLSPGTFRMGSNSHYPEEAPIHRVSVDGFWIDRTPVTNRQFKEFVRATGHVTSAEKVPNAVDYPNALPGMLFAGSLVFAPPRRPVDLRDWSQWWTLLEGANWRRPCHAPAHQFLEYLACRIIGLLVLPTFRSSCTRALRPITNFGKWALVTYGKDDSFDAIGRAELAQAM